MTPKVSSLMVILFVVAAISSTPAKAAWKERDVQVCVCKGMDLEVTMPSGGRADCVSDQHAIEVDKTSKWAEAIGQSLYYAQQTRRRAKVILFCKQKRGLNCLKDRLRFESTIAAYDLPIDLDVYSWVDLRELCRP